MNLFINYDPQNGLSVNTYRNNGVYGGVVDMVEALGFKQYAASCAYEGALSEIDSLRNADNEKAIEELRNFLTTF